MANWDMVLIEPIKEMLGRIGAFIPDLLAAVVIFFLGWILAKFIKVGLVKLLQFLKLDLASEKSGIADFLAKGEIKYSLSELLGVFAYWIMMLIVLISVVNILGLKPAVDLLNAIIRYIPNVVAGLIVLVLGAFFATLMGSLIHTVAANSGIPRAKTLADVTKYVIIIFAVAIAIEKFIGSLIIQSFFNILLATIGLTIALAFGLSIGLGSKDTMGRLISEFVDKLRSGK